MFIDINQLEGGKRCLLNFSPHKNEAPLSHLIKKYNCFLLVFSTRSRQSVHREPTRQTITNAICPLRAFMIRTGNVELICPVNATPPHRRKPSLALRSLAFGGASLPQPHLPPPHRPSLACVKSLSRTAVGVQEPGSRVAGRRPKQDLEGGKATVPKRGQTAEAAPNTAARSTEDASVCLRHPRTPGRV